MARKVTRPIVEAVASRLWARDQQQMRIVDRVLSAVGGRARRRTRLPARRGGQSWEGFRSILCAIDFSAQSRMALRCAAAMASRGRGTLRVVYVNDPLLVGAAAIALNDRELSARSEVELGAFIHATIPEPTRRSIRIAKQVAIGNPAIEIIAAAEASRADLIVVGTHGLTGPRRILLGSTTRQLLRETGIPVLAVPRMRRRGGAALLSSPGQRIIAAIELGDRGPAEVDVAARIAQSFNASLVMVHIVPPLIQPAWLRAMVRLQRRDRAAHDRQRLATLINRLRSRLPIDARVISGRVADGLASFATRERASLVVVALQGRRGSWLERRGSIAYSVLVHAATPVLAYPAGWRPR